MTFLSSGVYASDETSEELDSFNDELKTKEIYDPLNSYNRAMTAINDKIYTHALIPISKKYATTVHVDIRRGVSNFFDNLFYPKRVVNNLLQGKFKNSYEESQRFVINSTIGVLGIFDPAKDKFNIEPHDEDFGQTLGFYGVESGVHIVLPILGPSNLRDIFGIASDSYISAIHYQDQPWWTLTDNVGEYIGARSAMEINDYSFHGDVYEKMKKDAVDLYPYLRDTYEQRRKKLIKE